MNNLVRIFSILILMTTSFTLSIQATDKDPAYDTVNKTGHYAIQIETAKNTDGTVSIFFLKHDRKLSYIRQIAPNKNEWTKRISLGEYANHFAVGKHKDGRLDVFYTSALGSKVYHKTQMAPSSDEWSKDKKLKSTYAQQLETIKGEDGSLYVFALQMDKEVGYFKETAPNSNEFSKRINMNTGGNRITLGKSANGRIELFNIGTMGNVMYQISQSAPNSDAWMPEVELKGMYAAQIEVKNGKDGSLYLFALQMDREFGYMKQTAPNSRTWTKAIDTGMGGNGIELGKHKDGRIEIFNIGTLGNTLFHIPQAAPNSANWAPETEIKGYGKSIRVARNENGKLMLVAIAPLMSEITVNMEK